MRVKGKYEISVWENPLMETTDSNSRLGAENKLFVIGSDTMTSQNKIFSPIFTKNINGTMKLSFKIYYCYIDVLTGEKVNNPYVAKLVNETLIKLKYNDEWYDFIIKNITEDSTENTFTYDCVDLFYNELSRNGFNIEYDDSLNNNTKSAKDFVEEILEGTEWIYDDDSDVPKVEGNPLPEIIYNSEIGRVLNKYTKDDKIYYIVENKKKYNFSNLKTLISNGENFSDATGWQIIGSNKKPKIEEETTTIDGVEKTTTYLSLLKTTTENEIKYLNLGLFGFSGTITQGEEYFLKIKTKNAIAADRRPLFKILSIIRDDTNGYYILNNNDKSSYASIDYDNGTNNNVYTFNVTFLKNYTKEEITDTTNLGLIITSEDDLLVESISLYKKIPYAENSYLSPDDTLNYAYESIYSIYPEVEGKPDIKNKIESLSIEGYTQKTTDVKIKTLNIKQSNRYNLLQTIAETFKCWIKFEIEHGTQEDNNEDNNDGKILSKKIKILNSIENETGLTITYGIDLNSISRTIDSQEYTTKLYVIPDTNSSADSGVCAISGAADGTGENFIYNFDYYINNDLINKTDIESELNELNNLLKTNNTAYNKNIKDIIALEEQRINLKVSIESLTIKKSSLESSLDEKRSELEIRTDEEGISEINTVIATLENDIKKTSADLEKGNNDFNIVENNINTLTTQNETLLTEKNEKIKEFENKYYAFIQEGTWQSTDYISDDEYYREAKEVSKTSIEPKLTYNISISQVSTLEEFKNKIFDVGDIVYVIDKDFFFGDKDDVYKLKALITELTFNIEDPTSDSIVVKNYKTRFEDVFERIAANVQKMEFAKTDYDRASAAIKADKTIDFKTLQETFDKNKTFATTAQNQNIIQDDTGITIIDLADSCKKTKITSGGIFVTNNGGETWKNAIRGDGISTNLLTAGQIEVGKINLYDRNYKTFGWDSNGIIAYGYTKGIDETIIPDAKKYVKFYQDGIQINSSDNNDNSVNRLSIGKISAKKSIDSEEVEETYGIQIKNNEGKTTLETNSNGDLSITGTIYATDGEFKGKVYATDGEFKGKVYATDGEFTGEINATSGKIGKWNISEDGIEYITLPTNNNLIYIETSETSTSVKKYQLTSISNFSPFEEGNLISVKAVLENGENRKLFQYYKIKDINDNEINVTATSTGKAYCEKIDGIYYFYGTQFPNTYSKIEPGNIETSGSISGKNVSVENISIGSTAVKQYTIIKREITVSISTDTPIEGKKIITLSFSENGKLARLNNILKIKVRNSKNDYYNIDIPKGVSSYTFAARNNDDVVEVASPFYDFVPSFLDIDSSIVNQQNSSLGYAAYPWKEVYSKDYYYLDSNGFKNLKEEFSTINSTINNLLKIESTNVSIGDSTIGSLKRQVKAVIGNVALNQVTTDGPNFEFDKNFAPTTDVKIPVIVTYMDRNLLSYGKATLTIGLNSDKTSGIGTFISDTSVSGIIYSYSLNFGYEI